MHVATPAPFPSSSKVSSLTPLGAASTPYHAAAIDNIPKANAVAAAAAVAKAPKAQFAAKWGSTRKRLLKDKKTSNCI